MPENLPQLAGLSDDVRADLLRAQQAGTTTPQQLPRIKVMPAGAGLYEFVDSGNTLQSFKGVILNHHPRNVLWDKKFGVEAATAEEGLPACSSSDGGWGTPREGFFHAGLGRAATATDRVECRTCPYNQWGSGTMVKPDGNPKGKAVTNQRSVYVLVEGTMSPYELVLPPTSLPNLDEYITGLTNRGIPVQSVVTEFRQIRKERPNSNIRWGVATFTMAGPLDNETFLGVMAKRQEFSSSINPTPTSPTVVIPGEEAFEEYPEAEGEPDPDLPF